MIEREKTFRDALEKMANRYHDLSKANEHHGTDSDYYVQTGINELADFARNILKQADEVDNEQTIVDQVMASIPGDLLIFEYPQHGRDFDQKLAKKYLKKGAKYTIARIDIRSWSTDIFLEEIPGQCFNSVQFRVAS